MKHKTWLIYSSFFFIPKWKKKPTYIRKCIKIPRRKKIKTDNSGITGLTTDRTFCCALFLSLFLRPSNRSHLCIVCFMYSVSSRFSPISITLPFPLSPCLSLSLSSIPLADYIFLLYSLHLAYFHNTITRIICSLRFEHN